MRQTSFIITLFLLLGCAGESARQELRIYFSVNDLLVEQLHLLDAEQPTLNKMVSINEEEEKTSIVPDSTFWVRELEFLKDADINKPVHVGAFDEETSTQDQLEVVRYLRKDLSADGVKEMSVFSDPNTGLIRKLDISMAKRNALYNSKRIISLKFTNRNNQAALDHYSVTGEQKIIFKDSVSFLVNGAVEWPRD